MRKGVGVAVLVVLALAGILAAGRRHDYPAPVTAKNVIRVNLATAPTGTPIRPGFVGISTEYSALLPYAGRDPQALNPTFVRLVQNLSPGGAPVIRIGGDTTDWSWWPPSSGAAKPAWARFVLTPRWIAVARATALATGGHLILGINLESDSRTLVGAEAGALLRGVGRKLISAFELGNEPEVYGEIGWYRNAAGVAVLGRPPSYGFRAYLADYRAISSAVPGNAPLAGPALALTWPLSTAGRFMDANPRVRIFTFHLYPLKRCYNPLSSPTYPTLAHLLSPRSAEAPAGTRAAVAAAHARGVEVRVDEVNSVSCRGLPGLSDSFASALWIVDALFHMARAGVDGVNVHTLPHVSYEPFSFTRADGRWEASVKPMYYGMLLFTHAAPPGSRVLPTSQLPDNVVRTWATIGPRRTVRVVLINDSSWRGFTLAVHSPRPSSKATLERLTASGLSATGGVTLGGQSFGHLTSTGTLAGARQVAVLQPVQNRYVIKLPAASAALLTLSPA